MFKGVRSTEDVAETVYTSKDGFVKEVTPDRQPVYTHTSYDTDADEDYIPGNRNIEKIRIKRY